MTQTKNRFQIIFIGRGPCMGGFALSLHPLLVTSPRSRGGGGLNGMAQTL